MLSKIKSFIRKIQLSYIVSGVAISVIGGFITYYAILYLPSSSEQEITFKNIKTNYPINISKRLDEAISNYEAENYKSSLAHLNSILLSLQNSQNKISPRQESLVYSVMGACHYKLKRFTTSIKYLKKSLSLSPTSFSHKLLSEIYFEKFQEEKSEEYLKKYKEHADKAYKLKALVLPSKNKETIINSKAPKIEDLENQLHSLFFEEEILSKKSIRSLLYTSKNNEIKKHMLNRSLTGLDMDSSLISITNTNKKGEVHLVSIGINNYYDKVINPLKYAEKDSKDIIDSFSKLYGDKFFSYTLSGKDASKANIISIIHAISKKISEHDKIIVYYSGHGYSIKNVEMNSKTNYIVPVDGNINDIRNSAISLNYISYVINKNTKANALIIVDACNEYIHNNSKVNDLSNRVVNGSSYNTTAVYSSSSGQLSAESNKFKNGVFTYFFNSAIRNTKKVDANNDKNISIKELTSFVDSNMESYLSKFDVKQNISISKN